MTSSRIDSLSEFALARVAEDRLEARRLPDELADLAERILADCEAKRQIVILYLDAQQHRETEAQVMGLILADVLWYFTVPYSSHPDFREDDWKPYDPGAEYRDETWLPDNARKPTSPPHG